MFNHERLRRLELGGGSVFSTDQSLCLKLPRVAQGYADAQIDDYGLTSIHGRSQYPWRPGTTLQLRAQFSHAQAWLRGTAGFGFWNAPFGDPTVRWPALPQAVWFFFGSAPNNLPLAAPDEPGQGWFVSTLDAASRQAKLMIPFAPFVLLGNQFSSFRQASWPRVQRRLGISFAQIEADMTAWHSYRLDWLTDGCAFWIDGRLLLKTSHSPHGPLGFVCWLDNQYMVVTSRGKVGWGTLATTKEQWLKIDELEIKSADRKVTNLASLF